ncbi:MAG: transketolase family protein [Anaerovoracaceae bacterium]|nr:transketolase family protein [Bacillota bacterium]MDY2670415.1 transketolase family protein [Anaerovoracaceae bacterium]
MADKISTREAYGNALVKLGAENPDIVVFDADLSKSTKTAGFKEAYPDRFFNAGIAEANMMGMAAGMAFSGKTVFASTFAMFAAGRAYEIIRNSIGYPHANVKICATHSGVTVGEDGASHQCVEDLALMSVIPGMTVVHPADGPSTEKLLRQVAAFDGPAYVRLGRLSVPVIYGEDDEIVLGKANTLREGTDHTVIACGLLVNEALIAAEELAKDGISVRVLDMHTIKPLDEDAVVKAATETKSIITAEEHSVIGGLGSMVASVTARRCPARVTMVGIQDRFGQSGKPEELKKEYNITAADIVKAVKEADEAVR